MKDYTNILRKGHVPRRIRELTKRKVKQSQRLGLVPGQAFSWYSTSPSIVSTDDINSYQTELTGKKLGVSTIIATDLANGDQGSIDITVSENGGGGGTKIPITSVSATFGDASQGTAEVGTPYTGKIIVQYEPSDATGVVITYSSESSEFTVDGSGNISGTPTTTGTAIIDGWVTDDSTSTKWNPFVVITIVTPENYEKIETLIEEMKY